jgi:alkylhydroperoxidase family enzyme
MQTIQPVQPEDISRRARRLLDALYMEHGLSNMLKTMAHSPGTLEAYLEFNRELEEGPLGVVLAEEIALTVAQAEHAEYSLAFHTVRARAMSESTMMKYCRSAKGASQIRKPKLLDVSRVPCHVVPATTPSRICGSPATRTPRLWP